MDSFAVSDIVKLSELLKPPPEDEDADSDEEEKKNPYTKISVTSSTGLPAKPTSSKSSESLPYDPLDFDAFERWEEEQQKLQIEDDDPKLKPEYKIFFKQQVTTEDVFLQLGNKTPCTSSCEAMVIRVQLPATLYKEVQLDVEGNSMTVDSPHHHLSLHLPQPVRPNEGSAKWDADKEELEVTLLMDREYDLINF